MARARKSTSGKRKAAPRAVRPRRTSPDVERVMLALAQRTADVARQTDPAATSLRAALDTLLGAHAAHPAMLLDAWQRAHRDKRTALALGWAREQLRIAVADLLERETKAGRLPAEAPRDALAWLIVVASEAAASESAASVTDRVDALLAVLRSSSA